MTYEEFIKSKDFKIVNKSVEIQREDLNSNLFEYQKDLVYLALKKGKFALFAMTGTGKTAMQSEWAYQALKMGRKAILCELKKEYFEQIPKNMEMAIRERTNSKGLFDQ